MNRPNPHPRTGGTGMPRSILASVMTLGVAIATVTSAMALEGLAGSGTGQQVGPPGGRTVVTDVKVFKTAPDGNAEDRPVRVLKTTPPPKAVVKKRAVPVEAPKANVFVMAAPMAVNNEGQVQQYRQQFRPILRAEYHIARVVCRLTPEQRKEIARAGEQVLREAAKKYVDMMQRPMTAAQRAALDPRRQIREGLAQAVKTRLSPALAARFQDEIARRDASRKQLAIRNLVARLDRDLVLSPDQRGKVAESLTAHWDDSWCQSLEMFMYDYQFLPPIPDQYVAPFLNDAQKRIWRGTQKVQSFWGGFGMMGGIMVDDPLEDDELRLARLEAARKDPPAAPNQPGMMRQGVMMKMALPVQAPAVEVKVQAKTFMKKAMPAKAEAKTTTEAKQVAKPKP
jgi:hypothetical protein